MPHTGTPTLLARRLFGLMQRYVFLILSSWPRMVELVYWPTINMIVWGFVNFYIAKQISGTGHIASGILLGGAILWEMLIRSQFGLLISFFEELWSRNIGNIFVSPIKPLEYIGGLLLLSPIRLLICMAPCIILAQMFFNYSLIHAIGWPLVGFALNLMMTGWWCAFLLMAMILRLGMGAEWMAWILSFILSPLIAVYYPVAILPEWLQPVSWALPPTYIFEAMRDLAAGQEIREGFMLKAFALNFFYMAVSGWVFVRAFEKTRRGHGLLQVSE